MGCQLPRPSSRKMTLQLGGVKFNDVLFVSSEIEAGNGIVHIICAVLISPEDDNTPEGNKK